MMFSEIEVIRTISPNERMLAPDVEIYFAAGRSALEWIDLALRAAKKPRSDVKRILDLPCGHGRILRYLKAAFPEAELTACDIMRDGVDFCASTFGAVPVYSHDNPTQIPLEKGRYDLIWVGSLFTHFDVDLWPRYLAFLRARLNPNGVLVFTTHGYDAYCRMFMKTFDYWIPGREMAVLHDYERNGFAYTRYPGSPSSYYGLSLSSPGWVLSQIAAVGGLRVICFSEIGWVNFHDCFACVPDPEWHRNHADVSRHRAIVDRIRRGVQRSGIRSDLTKLLKMLRERVRGGG